MILTVTLNPCIDQTIFVDGLKPHDRNKVLRTETDAGGKGINLSRIVAELQGSTVATGFLGGGAGRFVAAVLERQGVVTDFVEAEQETRTNVSVESKDGPPTVFSAPGGTVSGLQWESLIATVARLAKKASWVALGGSFPPGISVETYQVLGALARDCGAKVLLDADGQALLAGLESAPDLVKPNRDEASRLLSRPVVSVQDAVQASKDIFSLQKSKGCHEPVALVSMGADGAVLTCGTGTFVGEPLRVEVKSTIGSGDSLLGAMLTRRESGDEWDECLKWGISAGAATAESDGTQIGRRADIEELVKRAVVRKVG